MPKQIHIVWSDGASATLRLEQNPAAEYYFGAAKHLRHLPLVFSERQNPYAQRDLSAESLTQRLHDLSIRLDVDLDQGLLAQQTYLNALHAIYMQAVASVPWDPAWLDFHDCIHLMETRNAHRRCSSSIWFDYQHMAGLLEKDFDRDWLRHAVSQVPAGTCFLREHELGKDLITCWKDGECNDVSHLCNLSKPWIRLRPLMNLAIEDVDVYSCFRTSAQGDFLDWLQPVREAWCQHWRIPDWTPEELFSMIPIGEIDDIELVRQRFMSYNYPTRLQPCHTQS